MTAYVTVQISMKDPDAFDAYRKVAGPALGKHGAKPISAGQAEVLHDGGIGTAPSVLLEFVDAEAARAWMSDPELADVHAQRNKGADVTLTLLPVSG